MAEVATPTRTNRASWPAISPRRRPTAPVLTSQGYQTHLEYSPDRIYTPVESNFRKSVRGGTRSPLVVLHHRIGDPSPLQANTERAGRARIPQATRGGSGPPGRSRHVT
jgi:hypothetical protein